MIRTAVIMAGGSGERFWPLSRRNRPKQLLALTSDKLMIVEAIERIVPLIPIEHIYIFTSEILQNPIRKALPNLPPENVVAEPFKRNTAPCLAYAAVFLTDKYGVSESEISMAILTADHFISTSSQFIQTVDNALKYAESNSKLVTIGIPPVRPETGYGYIEIDTPNAEPNLICPAITFREKPNKETASQFIKSGNFLWNSGMFFWRIDTFLKSIKQNLTSVDDKLEGLKLAIHNKTTIVCDGAIPDAKSVFEQFPDISIDYGIMEKADNVAVIRAGFLWDDVGSWDSLDRMQPLDEAGNVINGKSVLVDTHNSTIINSSDKQVVALIGADDIVVVVTDDAILVCPKDKAQNVRQAVLALRELGEENYL
ncbi:MAG: mannose-1-phosphate guanylyltransferase [Bacteroidetes bacterium]|nr:mannose-1-phosphate guanylyltransferase [Bacteroidota bacterium]